VNTGNSIDIGSKKIVETIPETNSSEHYVLERP